MCAFKLLLAIFWDIRQNQEKKSLKSASEEISNHTDTLVSGLQPQHVWEAKGRQKWRRKVTSPRCPTMQREWPWHTYMHDLDPLTFSSRLQLVMLICRGGQNSSWHVCLLPWGTCPVIGCIVTMLPLQVAMSPSGRAASVLAGNTHVKSKLNLPELTMFKLRIAVSFISIWQHIVNISENHPNTLIGIFTRCSFLVIFSHLFSIR